MNLRSRPGRANLIVGWGKFLAFLAAWSIAMWLIGV